MERGKNKQARGEWGSAKRGKGRGEKEEGTRDRGERGKRGRGNGPENGAKVNNGSKCGALYSREAQVVGHGRQTWRGKPQRYACNPNPSFLQPRRTHTA